MNARLSRNFCLLKHVNTRGFSFFFHVCDRMKIPPRWEKKWVAPSAQIWVSSKGYWRMSRGQRMHRWSSMYMFSCSSWRLLLYSTQCTYFLQLYWMMYSRQYCTTRVATQLWPGDSSEHPRPVIKIPDTCPVYSYYPIVLIKHFYCFPNISILLTLSQMRGGGAKTLALPFRVIISVLLRQVKVVCKENVDFI